MTFVDPGALRRPTIPEVAPEATTALPVGRPSRKRSWRAVRASFVCIVAIAMLAAAGFAWWDRTAIHSGGPVSLGSGILGQRLAVGEPTSFAGVMITNRSSKNATLEAIRVTGVTHGFEVLGVATNPWQSGAGVEATDARLVQGVTPGATVTLAGSPVIPRRSGNAAEERDQSIQLRITARTSQLGVARARGVEVTYRIGHRKYRRSYDATMYLCAPAERFSVQTCPGDAEGKFDDVSTEITIPR